MTHRIEQYNLALKKYNDDNLSITEVSCHLSISYATVYRWIKNRTDLSVSKPVYNHKKLDDKKLLDYVLEHPDMSQKEYGEVFKVDKSTICKAFKRIKVTRKKKDITHPKADKLKAEIYLAKLKQFKDLGFSPVYQDESGFPVHMPKRYGYAPKSQKYKGYKNWHEKGRINAVGSCLNNELISILLYECSVDGDVFYHYIKHGLLKELKQKSVIIMDNASFHKRQDILKLITDAGHKYLFLPPYSPHLNPIEKVWAKVKKYKENTQCTLDELFNIF